jgi:hypothetical protein
MRNHLAACAAILCALVAAAPAAAETGDAAPIRSLDEGGFAFPAITGPEAPEEYPFRVSLDEEQWLEQVTPTEVQVFYAGHSPAFTLEAGPAHDAVGSAVPTTLTVTGRDTVTWTISYRAGNPAAGGAPFVYPIVGGSGWEGGFRTTIVEMGNPMPPTTPPPVTPPPAPTCAVPYLKGFGLREVKALLRDADCAIGKVRLGRGATKAKGKVVKQFEPAGTELAAGAPVAVKLAGPSPHGSAVP